MARKRRPAPKYVGALAQPIYLDGYYEPAGPLGLLRWEPNFAAISKRAWEKMQLLFKHYEIDPSGEQRWQELAMSLALAHVLDSNLSPDRKSVENRHGRRD